ncbi:MAG: hypothetical protein WCT49_04150 [Candidatus Paceibacterota bacterium]|jgi:hypothetical protein|nr:hypothetical protein [Candidatus Paceibacterota bacterium]
MVKRKNLSFRYRPHPGAEEEKDEILYTYANFRDFENIAMITKRAGIVSYDKNGNENGRYPNLFPVFVNKNELKKAGYKLLPLPKRKK